ncbi:TPA: hypothetical protein ACP32N_003255 [Pseudomonas aeruginosa]
MDGQPNSPEFIERMSALMNTVQGKRILLLQNTVLLPPLDKVLKLLNISHRNLWDEIKRSRPGLPDFKTMAGLFEQNQAKISKGTETKLLRYLPVSPSSVAYSVELANMGFGFSGLTSWISTFENDLFEHQVAVDFWIAATKSIGKLITGSMRAAADVPARLQVYATAQITQRLGCPLALTRYESFVSSDGIGEQEQISIQHQHLLAVDCLATLLRLGAWVLADWQALHWDSTCSPGERNQMIGLSLIPTYTDANGWTSPIEIALERLASVAGWQGKQTAVTFLGKLWGGGVEGPDVASKIRLLRNWVQLRPARPSFEMLEDLVRLCRLEHARLQGLCTENDVGDVWLNASLLRVAETLSRLVFDFQNRGIAPDLIGSALGCFETEYRTAGSALGIPVA